jgi:hypothetical protein
VALYTADETQSLKNGKEMAAKMVAGFVDLK